MFQHNHYLQGVYTDVKMYSNKTVLLSSYTSNLQVLVKLYSI